MASEDEKAVLHVGVSFEGVHRYRPTAEDKEFEKQFLSAVGNRIDGHFYQKIVGVTFNDDGDNRQRALEVCKQWDTLLLVREAENLYDSNAVAVRTVDGVRLGYLERGTASEIAPDIDHRGRMWLAVVKSIEHSVGDHWAGAVICVFRMAREEVERQRVQTVTGNQ